MLIVPVKLVSVALVLSCASTVIDVATPAVTDAASPLIREVIRVAGRRDRGSQKGRQEQRCDKQAAR